MADADLTPGFYRDADGGLHWASAWLADQNGWELAEPDDVPAEPDGEPPAQADATGPRAKTGKRSS